VVICAYANERWDDLLAAIDSVADQRVAALETIVVIDHNEALLRRLRAAPMPLLRAPDRPCSSLLGTATMPPTSARRRDSSDGL